MNLGLVRSNSPAIDVVSQSSDRLNDLAYLVTYPRRQFHAHLRYVYAKRVVGLRRETESYSRQLSMFIDCSDTTPAAALYQPICSVNVEALLLLPVCRAAGTLETIRSRERRLRGEYERL